MKRTFLTILDAIDNPQASIFAQIVSGLIWLVFLASFFACCIFLAAVFQ